MVDKTDGIASSLVFLVDRGNGWEAVKQLYKEFGPQLAEGDSATLQCVLTPEWWAVEEAKNTTFTDVLIKWDQLIAKYEVQTG